jgi:hypothetical protein
MAPSPSSGRDNALFGLSLKLPSGAERGVLRSRPASHLDTAVSVTRRCSAHREPEAGRILQIRDYELLCASRETILRLEGFSVRSVSSNASFDPCWVRSFDLALVCQSVEAARILPVVRALRKCDPRSGLINV